MLSFSRGQALFLLMDLSAKIGEWKWWRGSVPGYVWFLLSLILAAEILSKTSVLGVEQLAEAAEMVCGWLTTTGEKRRELA